MSTVDLRQYLREERIAALQRALDAKDVTPLKLDGFQCPQCSSQILRAFEHESEQAFECVTCGHWGTLAWGFQQKAVAGLSPVSPKTRGETTTQRQEGDSPADRALSSIDRAQRVVSEMLQLAEPYREQPRINGVVWILLDEEKQNVMMERCAKKARVLGVGEWFLPGGKIEGDETPLAALEREIAEEWPSVKLRSALALPIVEGSPVPAGPRGVFLMRPYLVTVEGKLGDRSSEGTELRWIWIEGQLGLYSIVPQVRMMVAAAIGAHDGRCSNRCAL